MAATGKLPGGWGCEEAIWQLVECCGYAADLPAWRELSTGADVLDLGCGIGRVGHDLAGRGGTVLGLDRSPCLVDEFNRLAPAGATAQAAELLDPDLSPGRFAAVIAPQQLLQIVGGAEQRRLLLSLAARTIATGGLAAFAITEELPAESLAPDLTPDLREIEGWVYASRPTALTVEEPGVTVHRVRHRISPDGSLTETGDRITFARLDRDSVRPELAAAGLRLREAVEVPATEAHMGSTILVLAPLTSRR